MILFETDKKPLTFLMDQIENCELALPDFQRSFVWDPGATRELAVSILQSFPAGSLLLMQGGSSVFAPRAVEEAPTLKAPPSYLVLDGQQRLTSLYQAFGGKGTHRFYLNLQEVIDGEDLDEAVEVYPSKAAARWADTAAQAQDLMLPLSRIRSFSSWKSDVLRAYLHAGEDIDKLDRALIEIEHRVVDGMKLYQFPVTTLASSTPSEAVCTIFETLNRTGVKLSVFELLTARAFAREVHLREMWQLALDENPIIEEFNIDPYYVLQIIAVLVGGSPKRSAVIGLGVEEIVAHWDAAITGVSGSLKLMRDECGVIEPKWLPYSTMIITMAAAWGPIAQAKGPGIGARLEKLKRWFWCAVFGAAYENAANSATERDVPELAEWLEGGEEPDLVYSFTFDPTRWREISPRQRAQYRASIALLLQGGPRDFHQGLSIHKSLIDASGIDDHHIFPRAYLHRIGQAVEVDSVLNHTLIDKKTNIRISDKAPSQYLREMGAELGSKLEGILASHGLPSEPAGPLWTDRFPEFLDHRQAFLFEQLKGVVGFDPSVARAPRPARQPRRQADATRDGTVPLRVKQLIQARARTDEARAVILKFVQNMMPLPGVVVKAGRSTSTADGLGGAVQLHRSGSGKGAFAYVWPKNGRMRLRLRETDVPGLAQTRIRSVKADNPYRVHIVLSEDTLEEAEALARKAYERASG